MKQLLSILFLFVPLAVGQDRSLSGNLQADGVVRYDRKGRGLWELIETFGWIVKSRPFGKSVAFLVGVGDYVLPNSKLRYVGNDLDDVRDFLLNEQGFDTVYVARDSVANADLVDDYMLAKFPEELGSDDRFFFYFSGHGADVSGIGYMLFGRAGSRYERSQYLEVTKTEQWSTRLPAKHAIFLIDACNSGLGYDAKENPPNVDAELVNLFSGGGSRNVLTAGTGSQQSFEVIHAGDDHGNSVFTRAFLDSVRQTDSEGGFLTLTEVFAGAERRVAAFSRAKPFSQMTPRRWQIPRTPGKDKGTFVFFNSHAKKTSLPFVLKPYVTTNVKGDKAGLNNLATAPTLYRAPKKTLPMIGPIIGLSQVYTPGGVRDAQYSPDGTLLVSWGEEGNTAEIWRINDGKLLSRLSHDSPVAHAVFSPNGQDIITSGDKTVRLWNARSGQLLFTLQHDHNVTNAIFSADGLHIVTDDDTALSVWSISDGKRLLSLISGSSAISADGLRFVRVVDGTAQIWDSANGKMLGTFEWAAAKSNPSVRLVFSADGQRLIAVSKESIRVLSAEDGTLISTFPRSAEFGKEQFSPNGQRVLTLDFVSTPPTGHYDKLARLWDAENGRSVALLQHGSSIESVDFSADAKYIVTSSEDKTARVWNATDGQLLSSFVHNGSVEEALFSPDDKFLVTFASEFLGTTFRLWDVKTGQLIFEEPNYTKYTIKGRLPGVDFSIVNLIVKFSPDSHSVLTFAGEVAHILNLE